MEVSWLHSNLLSRLGGDRQTAERSLLRIDSGPQRLFNQIRTGLSESSVLEGHGVSRDVPSLPGLASFP
jgi:hypothetical protein